MSLTRILTRQLLFAGGVLALVGLAATSAQAQVVRVCATTPDVGSLVREVGGDQVAVTVFAKGTEDPHFLEAEPSFVRDLSGCDLVVYTGMSLEVGYLPLLIRQSNNSRIAANAAGNLDCSRVIKPMEVPTGEIDRSQGDVHPEGNPHYLLDPLNGLKVARLIRDRLIELRPDSAQSFNEPPAPSPPRPGMIQGFLDSWDLFHNTYLSGWLIGVVLALVGVLVVARNQIFIGAAVAQASTLGIALALWLGSWSAFHAVAWLHSDDFLSALAVVFAVGAALLTAGRGETRQESHEALTGWLFLISASLSILIVAASPHGLAEIQRLLSSSIIGATAVDVGVFGGLALATAAGLLVFGRRLMLFALDPEMAAAVGMRTRLWAIGFCLGLGLVVGLSMRASGMLYTFGCLVLPALVAKQLCREVRPMFVAAPLVALAAGVVGFVLAHHYDFPPAQMTVALLSVLLTGVWCMRALWRAGAGWAKPAAAAGERTHAPADVV